MLMAPTHPESQEGSVLCLHHIITAGGLVEGFESGGAQGAVVGLDLDVSAGVLELALVLQLLEIDLGHLSESPHGAEDDLLLARELELGAAQSLSNIGLLGLAGADAHQGLANADTGHNTLGLTEGTTHTSLESAHNNNNNNNNNNNSTIAPSVSKQASKQAHKTHTHIPGGARVFFFLARQRGRGKHCPHLSAPAQESILLMRVTWKG